MFNYILKILYPPMCIICKELLEIGSSEYFCEDCKKTISFISESVCTKCGKPVESHISICKDCIGNEYFFEKNFSVFIYDDLISDLIKKFKYQYHPYYGKGLGELMALFFNEYINQEIDYLIPVPIHKIKKLIRGFNQAEILSECVSRNTGIPILTDILVREKNTKPQSSLSKEDRKKNLENVFNVKNNTLIKSKIIMLIDDIYTTGSTLDACSKILKNYGASEVYGFCLSTAIKNRIEV